MVNQNIGKTRISSRQTDWKSTIDVILFRRTLVQSFLYKFYVYVCTELNQSSVDPKELSIAHPYHRPVSHGQQIIPERPSSQKVVGTSLPHRSAYLQTTGEAKYIDDMPSLPNTLHAALVLATQPNARIKNIGKTLTRLF